MRIGDDSGIVQLVWTSNVWQESVHQEDIALFRSHAVELLASNAMLAVNTIHRRIDTLWMIQQVLASPYNR
jgi:hypothetical protein